jgi:type I restriction enzyme R subunit
LTRLLRNAKSEKVNYENYLANIVALTKKAQNPTEGATYPASLNSPARRALYDNLGKDEKLALAVDSEIRMTKKDDWRGNQFKEKEVRNAIRTHITDEALASLIFELVMNQHEY